MEKLQIVLPKLMGSVIGCSEMLCQQVKVIHSMSSDRFYQEHNLFEDDDKRYFSSMRNAALKGAFGSHAIAMSAAYLGSYRFVGRITVFIATALDVPPEPDCVRIHTNSCILLGLRRLPVRAPMPMSILIGLLAVPIGSAYFVRPVVPEVLYLDTSFGAEARERYAH